MGVECWRFLSDMTAYSTTLLPPKTPFYHLVPLLSPSSLPEGRNLVHWLWCIRSLIPTSPWLTPAYLTVWKGRFGPLVISFYEMGTLGAWHRTVKLPIDSGQRESERTHRKKHKFQTQQGYLKMSFAARTTKRAKRRSTKPKFNQIDYRLRCRTYSWVMWLQCILILQRYAPRWDSAPVFVWAWMLYGVCAHLNRRICILLLSQRRYWLPVVVTWNFACTATLRMVAPSWSAKYCSVGSERRHWPPARHIYVRHVDEDDHISWLFLLSASSG